MKLVYPVTSKNAPQYTQLSLLFEKLGPHSRHELLLVSCPSALEAAQEFGESVKRLFRDVTVVTTPSHVHEGNAGRNILFAHAALEAAKGHTPWIWMEYATPCDRGWLDQVEYDYNGLPGDRPFMGCLEKTFFYARDEKGTKRFDESGSPLFTPRGEHMRFGVYPASFASRSTLLGFLPVDQPFEVALQEEVVHFCHPYPKFITVWQSRDFDQTTKGYAMGKQTPGVESEIRKPGGSIPYTNYLVIHGCRDSSLSFIIQRRAFTQTTKEEIKERYIEKLDVTKGKLDEERELAEATRLSLVEKMEEVADLLEERNTLRAEIEALKQQLEVGNSLSPSDFEALAERVGERDEEIVILKAQVERLKKDAVPPKKKIGRPKAVRV